MTTPFPSYWAEHRPPFAPGFDLNGQANTDAATVLSVPAGTVWAGSVHLGATLAPVAAPATGLARISTSAGRVLLFVPLATPAAAAGTPHAVGHDSDQYIVLDNSAGVAGLDAVLHFGGCTQAVAVMNGGRAL